MSEQPDAPADADDTEDDDGLSTVAILAIAAVVAIPVLLVVTVIGSAVIGAFVLGLDDGPPPEPTVEWESSFDEGSGTLTAEHVGGDAVEIESLSVTVEGQGAEWSAPGQTLQFGDELVVSGVSSGDTVRITWGEGDAESIVGEFVAAP